MLCLGTAVFSMFFFLTQYLQNVHGYSAVRTGLAFLPMALGIMVAAVTTSRVLLRVGIRVPLLIGPAMVFVGLAWLTRLTPTSSYLQVLGPLVLLALGMGMSFVPLTTTAVSGVKAHETGLASALLNTSQQVGGALGLAVLGTVAITVTRNSLAAASGHIDPAVAATATTQGYTRAFAVAAGIALAGFLVSLAVIRVKEKVPVAATAPASAS
jgi:predicted MFS family arabinose efflux permease